MRCRSSSRGGSLRTPVLPAPATPHKRQATSRMCRMLLCSYALMLLCSYALVLLCSYALVVPLCCLRALLPCLPAFFLIFLLFFPAWRANFAVSSLFFIFSQFFHPHLPVDKRLLYRESVVSRWMMDGGFLISLTLRWHFDTIDEVTHGGIIREVPSRKRRINLLENIS